jgi:ATP-dependent RNA helicase DDX5/DBP2
MTQKNAPNEAKLFRSEHNITVNGDDGLDITPLFTFEKGNFPKFITSYLEKSKFVKPTPIQAQTLPITLQKRDIIAISETGSGKTLAFLIPALLHILSQKPLQRGDGPICVVVAPTRELALQIEVECNKILAETKLKCACIYGGASKGPQASKLRSGCEIIIATPGRLLDFLTERVTNLNRSSFVVLDEADRMLDLGFKPQIDKILQVTPKQRHTLMFSATWGASVQDIARNYLYKAVKVQLGSKELSANKKVEQRFVKWANEGEKIKILTSILSEKINTKILLFVTRKRDATKLAKALNEAKFKAFELHGDKSQNQREDAMKKFLSGQITILVATDVASRGLDVKDIETVINYDLPIGGEAIETYVHRIGRTSRTGGLEGEAITFVGPNEEMDFMESLQDVLKVSDVEISQVVKDYTEMSKQEKAKLSTAQRDERKKQGKIIEENKQARRLAKRQQRMNQNKFGEKKPEQFKTYPPRQNQPRKEFVGSRPKDTENNISKKPKVELEKMDIQKVREFVPSTKSQDPRRGDVKRVEEPKRQIYRETKPVQNGQEVQGEKKNFQTRPPREYGAPRVEKTDKPKTEYKDTRSVYHKVESTPKTEEIKKTHVHQNGEEKKQIKPVQQERKVVLKQAPIKETPKTSTPIEKKPKENQPLKK